MPGPKDSLDNRHAVTCGVNSTFNFAVGGVAIAVAVMVAHLIFF